METYGTPEKQPVGVKVKDVWGKDVEVAEWSLDQKLRLLLTPLLLEAGVSADALTKYEYAASQLVGLAIAEIRDMRSRLDIARREFQKVNDRQKADHDLIVNYIRRHSGMEFAPAEDTGNVIPLRKAA